MKKYTTQYIAMNSNNGTCELYAVAIHNSSDERISVPNMPGVSDEIFQETFRQGTEFKVDDNGVVYIANVALYKRHPKPCGVPK